MQFTYRRGTTRCTTPCGILLFRLILRTQVLKTVSRKLAIAPDADFSEIARKTEGFSGADLQALLYNAHLDVIHSAISESHRVRPNSEEVPLEYVVISSSGGKSAITKAEERALQQRVSPFKMSNFLTHGPNSSSVTSSRIPRP